MPRVLAKVFEDIELGVEYASPTRTISESDVYLFAGLTGDLTDFHISKVAARESLFGRRPAHGMLLIAIANGLYHRIGITDGTTKGLGGVEWRFRAPAFIGDTIHLVASAREKRELETPDRGLVFFAARLVNQDGRQIGEGQFIRFIERRPA